MSARLVAERYSRALGATVEDDAELETLLGALEEFARIYSEHADLSRVLEDHAIARNEREAVFREVLDRSEGPDLARRFLLTLFRRGRIVVLPEVLSTLRVLVNRRLNRAQAAVTLAVSPAPGQLEKIESGLEKFSGKNIEVEMLIDPDILGGVVVELDVTVIDASLRTRLDRIRTALLTEEND